MVRKIFWLKSVATGFWRFLGPYKDRIYPKIEFLYLNSLRALIFFSILKNRNIGCFFKSVQMSISLFRTFLHARRLKNFVHKPQYIIFMTLNFQLDWMYPTLFLGYRHFWLICLVTHLKYAYKMALICIDETLEWPVFIWLSSKFKVEILLYW